MFWRQTHGKDEVSEMLMFSGLETQSEISLLLDELYGGLSGRASLERVGGERPALRWGAEHPEGERGQAREGGHQPLCAEVQATPNQDPLKLAVVW